jgi:hypothetical protein
VLEFVFVCVMDGLANPIVGDVHLHSSFSDFANVVMTFLKAETSETKS